ncbi:C6 transcription factor [Aspergillus sclerotialis]|uniref:C6 transcription factor n=1 Tax=Aspergillus sclerotialis TaxID=2070753 RepID=A0A3A3ADH0_9EURO|nr:C6 transcription factor [Aspergillus sclerotialis]
MHYLQYYVEQGSKLLANLETDENPLRSLIIPRALMSPLLMKAVCAVSAIHLGNRYHGGLNSETTATDYYTRTLRGLRSSLSESPSSLFRDDTILAVAFLCKYEIVRGSVKQWTVHLDALQKLVISRGGFACLDRETAEFIWGLFMYAHNVAKITNRRQSAAITPGPINVSITKLDIYVGYTEEIIKICARIADIPYLNIDSSAIRLEVYDIDESLRNWTHSTRQYIIPKGITEATLTRLQMVADCFHDAAYIYLHSTLERMSYNSACTLPSSWASLISVGKSEALHACLDRIAVSPLDNQCEYSALTFPLFIAGCESQTLEERRIVVHGLSMLEVNFGIGNVKRVKELLNVLWKEKGSVHWQDVLEQLQWDLILA